MLMDSSPPLATVNSVSNLAIAHFMGYLTNMWSVHYSDVIMSAIVSQITGVSFVQPFVQAQIKENIKAPRH